MVENNNKKIKQHCCEIMEDVLEETRSGLIYIPVFREYAVHVKYFFAGKLISFCGWCGTKLPSSLREKYFEILKNEYQLNDVNLDTLQEHQGHLPEAFKSDLWWQERGL